jgi:hypothetical protein
MIQAFECDLTITQNGNTSSFTYAPDGELAGKTYLGKLFLSRR